MIFYFSGTGNSYQAALALKGEAEALHEMAACLRKGELDFTLARGEALGFVFPVYYGGMPSIVREFLARATFTGDTDYCYGVFTCGSRSFGTGDMLAGALRERGITLRAAFTVVMPENYVLMFKIDEEEARDRILSAAAKDLAGVRGLIDARAGGFNGCTAAERVMTRLMYPLYERGRTTRRFYADAQCVGCGVCAARCPVKAIEMRDGRPKWVKDKCVHCMACIRCGAVQYGKRTAGKKRYTNPLLKKHG